MSETNEAAGLSTDDEQIIREELARGRPGKDDLRYSAFDWLWAAEPTILQMLTSIDAARAERDAARAERDALQERVATLERAGSDLATEWQHGQADNIDAYAAHFLALVARADAEPTGAEHA